MNVLRSAETSTFSSTFLSTTVPAIVPSTTHPGRCRTALYQNVTIAIFDASVANAVALIKGLYPHITPHILLPEADGVGQLQRIFQSYSQPLTVHLFAHGSPGTLQLGNTELNLPWLDGHTNTLNPWLLPGSELLIYGCNVGAGEAGHRFLAKLHQLTGASIAASTQPIGNRQQGGTWVLDTQMGAMAIALPFPEAVAHAYPGILPAPIDSIDATYTDLPNNVLSYVVNGITHNFAIGTDNNLDIAGFSIGADNFESVQLIEAVELRRVDNPVITGDREIFWYELDNFDTANNTLDLRPSPITSVEEALLNQTINRGVDNVFANQGFSPNLNNIERVDFIERRGLTVPAQFLDDAGFLLLERGGNDPAVLAPILAIDENGDPTAYGALLTINAADWGDSGIDIETAVLNDQGTGGNPGLTVLRPPQDLSGIFVSFTDLGISGNQTFYGYSVFPGDVLPTNDLVGLTDADLATSDASGEGGLDLLAGGEVFLRSGFNVPPTLNLDPLNSSNVGDGNFATTFVGGAIDITADEATAFDPNNGGVDIESLTITTTTVPDGADEFLLIDGTSLPLVSGANATLTFGTTSFDLVVMAAGSTTEVLVTNSATGAIPNNDVTDFLRSLSYTNTDTTPTRTDRIFTFIASDGIAESNIVTSTLSFQPDNGTPPPVPKDCSNGLRLVGDAADNELRGSSRTDILRGLGRNDRLQGRACPDRLRGGGGNDRLLGGEASDTLYGGAGRDRMAGHAGDDTLFGGGGHDRINGGSNNDQINGQGDRDFLRGRAGSDQLRGGQGNDAIAGGAGDDEVFGGSNDDRIFGGPGRDRLRGNARHDRIFGGAGDDRLFGQQGRDLLRGESGEDDVRGHGGRDRLFGGAGNDRLFGGAQNDTLNGGLGRDRLAGQKGDDLLLGGQERDRLNGGGGNDRILGRSGNDRLLGKAGDDVLRGNVGFDQLVGGAGDDRIFGGRGNDRASAGARGDFLRGNAGADVLQGKAGRDFLRGDRGFDRLNGGQGNDLLDGGGAADRLRGRAGRDRLRGRAGNDRLLGNNGRDTLIGGTGNDELVGRAGGDTMQGNRGIDRFVFAGATVAKALRDSLVRQPDQILDFDSTEGDRFALRLTQEATANIPSALFNAGTIVANTLPAAARAAVRDRNPNQPGNQPLNARQALFFSWREQTYLLINNGNNRFDANQDLVAEVTGIQFQPGDANQSVLTVSNYFG